MNREDGITVVIPAYGPVEIVTRSVYSAVSAYRGKNSKYKLEVLIYADDIEYQEKNDGKSQYDYFTSEEFNKLIGKNLENNDELNGVNFADLTKHSKSL